jgi:hypothetical protein
VRSRTSGRGLGDTPERIGRVFADRFERGTSPEMRRTRGRRVRVTGLVLDSFRGEEAVGEARVAVLLGERRGVAEADRSTKRVNWSAGFFPIASSAARD